MRPVTSDGRYQTPPLATVGDLARRWWNAEVVATDAAGRPLTPLSPPTNEACRLSLASKEGARRCQASIAFAHEQARLKGAATHPCHLGFALVAGAMPDRAGSAVACGIRERTCSDEELSTVVARLAEISPDRVKLSALPGVGLLELARVRDLVAVAAALAPADSRAEAGHRHPRSASAHRTEDGPPMLGQSLAMLEVQKLLERIAPTDSTVLVEGESGTGKELVARRLHERGPRRDRPFVAQNCSALNDNLLESALFGHVRGAFTGATRDASGLFDFAHGGTLFLDEIGDMSPALQAKLLRVLQEGAYTPLGSNEARRADVRVIAATHKELARLVQEKLFREDLFYRIHVLHVVLPPLREREDDLELLAAHFLRVYSGSKPKRLAPGTTALFRRYPWPGNVRELQHEIERMCVLAGDEPVLSPELVSSRIQSASAEAPKPSIGPAGGLPKLHDAVAELERSLIQEALRRHRGNRSRVARELGVARSNLVLKLARYKL